jgi:hypothetical protein
LFSNDDHSYKTHDPKIKKNSTLNATFTRNNFQPSFSVQVESETISPDKMHGAKITYSSDEKHNSELTMTLSVADEKSNTVSPQIFFSEKVLQLGLISIDL